MNTPFVDTYEYPKGFRGWYARLRFKFLWFFRKPKFNRISTPQIYGRVDTPGGMSLRQIMLANPMKDTDDQN